MYIHTYFPDRLKLLGSICEWMADTKADRWILNILVFFFRGCAVAGLKRTCVKWQKLSSQKG